MYLLNANTFEQQYKEKLSNFLSWDQKEHAEQYILFPENLGKRLCIDETSLSNGELYTIITNADMKGRAGSLVAIIKGTSNSTISEVLRAIPLAKRLQVEEVTADMANSMDWIIRCNFPQAIKIVDRFHVQKLVFDALQDVRIALRWKAIAEETTAMKQAKGRKERYRAPMYENGDTKKQLLARSRYLLFKPEDQWKESQNNRASILFREFPEMKQAYELAMQFRQFYEQRDIAEAVDRLQGWYEAVEMFQEQFSSFVVAKNSVKAHQVGILNYFEARRTNASAESFNAKIKGFRSLVRGVKDKKFSLFRIAKLYG